MAQFAIAPKQVNTLLYTGSDLYFLPATQHRRAPTIQDRGYPLLTFWRNMDQAAVLPDVYGDVWVLVKFIYNPASDKSDAIWVKIISGSGSGGVLTLTPDTGGVIVPVGGNIDILGEPAFTTKVMETHNIGGQMFIENKTWSTPYVVDANTVIGERGTYSTIQSAINAAFADGSASLSSIALIDIREGIYTENLVFPASALYYLRGAFAITGTIQGLTVTITGAHTLNNSSGVTAQNIAFNNATPPFTLAGTNLGLSLYNCACAVNVTGATLSMDGCTQPISMTLSGGVANISNSQMNTLIISGGTQTFTNCQMANGTLSNSVAPLCRYCIWPTNGGSWGGTTSGIPEFYDCINSSTFSFTGTIRVGSLSQAALTTGDFFGSGITETLARTTQGNVLIRRTVAADAVVTNANYYIGVTSTAAARTITLPTTANTTLRPYKGQCFKIKDQSGGAGTNNITVVPNGGTINGASSYVINTDYGFVEVMFDGTNYFTIGTTANNGWNLISTTSISGTPTSLVVNSGLTEYREIKVDLINVATSGNAGWVARFSTDGGSTFVTCSSSSHSYNGIFAASMATTSPVLSRLTVNGIGTAGINGSVQFDNTNLSIVRLAKAMITTTTATADQRSCVTDFNTDGNSAQINYFEINAGGVVTFSSGTVNVYGRN